jgi:hypothetical protein
LLVEEPVRRDFAFDLPGDCVLWGIFVALSHFAEHDVLIEVKIGD